MRAASSTTGPARHANPATTHAHHPGENHSHGNQIQKKKGHCCAQSSGGKKDCEEIRADQENEFAAKARPLGSLVRKDRPLSGPEKEVPARPRPAQSRCGSLTPPV